MKYQLNLALVPFLFAFATACGDSENDSLPSNTNNGTNASSTSDADLELCEKAAKRLVECFKEFDIDGPTEDETTAVCLFQLDEDNNRRVAECQATGESCLDVVSCIE